jgi:RNA polymerase sigma factor (sigma-70 family)
MRDDDRQLLIATHRGHEASARLLWARHAPRLRAHAAAIVRDGADDVVQCVMCRLLELSSGRIRAIEDVGAFLATAVRREALNHLRSIRRAGARATARPSTAHDGGGPQEDIRAAVDDLPRRLREVVVLKHIGDLTFDQIASALATNRNTIASRYRAALQQLREAMTQGVAHA